MLILCSHITSMLNGRGRRQRSVGKSRLDPTGKYFSKIFDTCYRKRPSYRGTVYENVRGLLRVSSDRGYKSMMSELTLTIYPK